jgi:hypothetical protein
MLASRLKTGLAILALIAVSGIAAAVVLSLVRGDGPPGSTRAARELCLAGYRRARSAADSSIVDAWTPVISKSQAAFAKSCALVRREGELQAPGSTRADSRVAAP